MVGVVTSPPPSVQYYVRNPEATCTSFPVLPIGRKSVSVTKWFFLVIRSQVNVRHRLSHFSFGPVLRETFPLTRELFKSHLSAGKLSKWKD